MSRILRNYVDALDVAAEDRILLGRMRSRQLCDAEGRGCLIGLARGVRWLVYDASDVAADRDVKAGIGKTFNAACHGRDYHAAYAFDRTAWVANAIRNRILSNRAKRTLAAPHPLECYALAR